MKTPSFATKLAIAAICAAAIAPASRAAVDPSDGYVTLDAPDAAGTSSFNSAGHWSDGDVPSPGKKYLVYGQQLRTPYISNPTFAGVSLTLDNGGSMSLKSPSGATVSANYILHQGTIQAVDNGYSFTLAGTMEICGTESAPSVIALDGQSRSIAVAAPLSGGTSAFLKASHNKPWGATATSDGTFVFSGDNSGYQGRISFATPPTAGTVSTLRFDGETSAGISGDPSGMPFLAVGAGVATPVVELKNAKMGSTFTIENNNANARIELTGSNVLFGATMTGSAADIPVKVNGDAMLQSASPLALDFSGGGRLLARLNTDGTTEFSSIAESSVLTLPGGKIPVKFDGVIPHTNANFSATLFKIPTSVMAVTADDIDLYADDFDLMTIVVSVANGIQTVSLRAGNVVYYSVPNAASGWGNWAAYNQAAQYWSDNRAVHPDADYLINYDVPAGCYFLRGCQQTFAGRSLTFARGGRLALKGRLTAPDNIVRLRMFPGSTIATGDDGTDYNALSGGLLVAGRTDDDPVDFVNSSKGTLNLLSDLSGSGPVRFVSDNPVTVFPIVLAGNNGSFTGKMEFFGSNAGRSLRVSIRDESSFGGNPAAFDAAQTHFNGCVELVVTNDVAIDDANRGMTFSATPVTGEVPNPVETFNVAAGATLTLDVPMVVNMNLAKTGAGTLGIGGSIIGTASNLAVSAGSVMPVTRQASSALRYTMAAGTGLALALDATDADVAADGLYVEDATHLTLSGSSLPVTIRGAIPDGGVSVKCGIVNVPASMADAIATALGGNATFSNTDTGRTRAFPIERETLAGDRVRFFATIGKGPTTIIMR